ncbi:MAG: hypothetical protein ABFC12_06125 [Methanobacterium sp.]
MEITKEEAELILIAFKDYYLYGGWKNNDPAIPLGLKILENFPEFKDDYETYFI